MRPNRVGWFLVAFFFVGGFVFWRAIPEIFIGQIWMAVAALLAVLYVVMTIRANRSDTLVASGIRGRAHVLQMTQTGTYVNNQPRVKLRLRIEAPGVTPYETEDTVTVPLVALGTLQPGRPLPVALDPADPQKFVIDWFGNPAGPPITFTTADGQTANLAGDPASTAAVMDVLQKYGLQPGQVADLRAYPQAREEVLAALHRAGYLGGAVRGQAMPPGQQPTPPATFGASPVTAVVEDPDPAVRLQKLTELRDSGAISAVEFDEHKRRILSDI